jgi:hypothetical protein
MANVDQRGTPIGRNLVICCDGTNNEFGPENTNVVRLVQVLKRYPNHDDPAPVHQLVYYDPGVGTLPEPAALTRLGKRLSTWFELAFATDLERKVGAAYTYLMENWEAGDHVFLFGFSRGAYTVRVLAGLLHALGLLPRGSANIVPYVWRLYGGMRRAGSNDDYWRLCDEFRWTFARPIVPGSDDRRFQVHFLGVWDTVSSVGWVWNPATFRFTKKNPSIAIIRHAVAVDERRSFFRQNLMELADEQQKLEQRWFPGVHADVGGGYRESEGGLWRMPFLWVLEEAEKAGLRVDVHDPGGKPSCLKAAKEAMTEGMTEGSLKDLKDWKGRFLEVWRRPPYPGRPWAGPQEEQRLPVPERPWAEPAHESLTPLWWLAEFVPKFPPGRSGLRLPRLGLGRHRSIPRGALIDQSTLLRIRDRETNYAPPNFPKLFLEKIRALTHVPETLQFEVDDHAQPRS